MRRFWAAAGAAANAELLCRLEKSHAPVREQFEETRPCDSRRSSAAGSSAALAGSAVACTLPKLAVIPPKDQVAGKEGELTAAMSEYSAGMDAYVGCIRAELDAAGGDNAPTIVRRVLVSRNNTAVAEKEFMIKLYTDNVASAAPAAPAPAGR